MLRVGFSSFLPPPIMASFGSNGDCGPKSTTNPVFLLEDFHTTLVPDFTQNRAFFLGSVTLAVAEAELPSLLTLTVQGSEADQQVLAALHSVSGFASEQAYLLFF